MVATSTTLDVPRDTVHSPSAATTLAGEDMMEDKTRDSGSSARGDDEKSLRHSSDIPSDQLRDDEYPSGFQMFFIILALVLGVFLLSLDMVSNKPLTHDSRFVRHTKACLKILTRPDVDHCCHGYPQNHGRFQRPRQSWLVWRCLLHDCWCFSVNL